MSKQRGFIWGFNWRLGRSGLAALLTHLKQGFQESCHRSQLSQSVVCTLPYLLDAPPVLRAPIHPYRPGLLAQYPPSSIQEAVHCPNLFCSWQV